MARGLPASPGAATGQIVFFAEDAETYAAEGKPAILVRQETSPEDLRGMSVAKGILTVRGGMTSHAAIVARGMGKCCVSGAGTLHVDYKKQQLSVNGNTLKKGDWISLNGDTGEVYPQQVPTKEPQIDNYFAKLMRLADKHARMEVRTNADSPDEASIAKKFGAKGIGLCRTEHMFFEGDRITAVREMILADDEAGRRKALEKLLPMQRDDFEGIFRVMKGNPVTIRLLDPPLHEFLPHELSSQKAMADDMHVGVDVIRNKVENLEEVNPMLGHRGCRLGITFPEITEMQVRAIMEAALNVKREGIHPHPEIMLPLIGREREYWQQEDIIRAAAQRVFHERKDRISFKVGTMIEIPRAALTADQIAEHAEFFSFGTNDLTQMTFGFSRDDIGKFLPIYMDQGIIDYDPFKRIDEEGVGRLVNYATKRGRKARPDLKLGICGEHGGNPESIDFFERIGLDYVSCSPYRVPIARLATAQAFVRRNP
jgi:pyruvate,orthophosphate dikinase